MSINFMSNKEDINNLPEPETLNDFMKRWNKERRETRFKEDDLPVLKAILNAFIRVSLIFLAVHAGTYIAIYGLYFF